ncbi:hypothetical protein BF49_1657 [Bradyrhizobium sp.]|nr:hypothetical protein BF49_1657 [Bradyrhizobium sp.]
MPRHHATSSGGTPNHVIRKSRLSAPADGGSLNCLTSRGLAGKLPRGKPPCIPCLLQLHHRDSAGRAESYTSLTARLLTGSCSPASASR